jgi:arylsulfatase A-like enzyme
MPREDHRPDVLLVLSDQHRASALGCAAEEPVETPNLDSLADEGTRFENAFANVPLCAPSRASLLTGRYPRDAGVTDNGDRLSPDATTIGEAFSAAGYETCYVGKWHLSGDAENYGPTDAAIADHVRSRGFDRAVIPEAAHAYFDVDHYVDGERVETEGYAPAVQTEYALKFLRESAADPRLLVVSYGPPHNPYEQVPDEFRDRYDPAEIPVPPNVEPILPYAGDHPEPTPLWAPPASVDVDEVGLEVSDNTYLDPREGLADYYAQITAVDHEVGRLLDGLDEFDAARDSVVAYTSDHGDQLWSQGHAQKGVPYDESVNVPLIVRWPDELSEGRVTDGSLGLVDVAPTLAGLTGVESPSADAPDDSSGADLSALVRGETDEGRQAVPLLNDAVGWHGVRTRRYTYARTDQDRFPHLRDGGWLFFDDETDPYQLRNRLYEPDYAEARAECERLVEEFLTRTDDPFAGGGQTK